MTKRIRKDDDASGACWGTMGDGNAILCLQFFSFSRSSECAIIISMVAQTGRPGLRLCYL